MSDSVREIAKARIRAQHPNFDEDAVRDELTWDFPPLRPCRRYGLANSSRIDRSTACTCFVMLPSEM